MEQPASDPDVAQPEKENEIAASIAIVRGSNPEAGIDPTIILDDYFRIESGARQGSHYVTETVDNITEKERSEFSQKFTLNSRQGNPATLENGKFSAEKKEEEGTGGPPKLRTDPENKVHPTRSVKTTTRTKSTRPQKAIATTSRKYA